LFLSYATEDRTIAERIRDELVQHIDVFMDTKALVGGTEWEREIEAAIRRCSVFAPCISTASNKSRWVAKETLLALKLDVPILPLLCSDALPLRVIDRQFIDFRDNFEAGLSDLFTALASHIGPLRLSTGAVDTLIAKAIRARLREDIRTANALVEQVVRADNELASTGYVFWRKLQTVLDTDCAKAAGPELIVRETTTRLRSSDYEDGRGAYEWALELHGPAHHLSAIDVVVYTLDPTFDVQVQKVRSREDNFRIERVGWGQFPVKIQVEFVDYTAVQGEYWLTFDDRHEARLLSS